MEKRKNIWLLTGPPGIGKSTILSRVILNLRSRGVIVGGCVTSERRVNGQRVGFSLRDLLTGEEGELASVEGKLGPRVGKYRVNLNNLSAIGVRALAKAAREADLIVVDEIGPMELTSPDFRRILRDCISSSKPLLAVVHERMNDPLIDELKRISGTTALAVDLENRDNLPAELTQRVAIEVAPGEKP